MRIFNAKAKMQESTEEGIDASRLEAIGMGSSQLKNTDDPTAQENRRTEFIVVE